MKRAVAALFGFWLICLLCPVAFAATVTIAVRTESTVAGPWLTLGDIADVSGEVPERVKELRELKLGNAPDPGTTVFMTPVSLEPKLAANRIDFSGISWNVPGQFKITTLSQPVSGRKVADLAREYLTRTAQDSTVSLLDLPADIQAPVGALELVPELFGAIRFSGPTTVNIAVRTAGRTFMKIPVRFEVRRYLDVVVTAVNLNAGDILSEQSLRLERMDAGKMPAGYLTDPGKALGLQVRQALPPGSVISERNLTRPILVKRGELVRIAAHVGGIEVQANGIAFSQGAAGDLIRVQNTATKKFLTGRLQEDKSVLVIDQPGG